MMNATFSFIDGHLAQFGLAHQIIDTGSILRQNQTPQLFEQMHRVRRIFDGVSLAFSIVNFVQVCVEAERKWKILSWAESQDLVGTTLSFPFFTYVGVAIITVRAVNRFFSPSQDPQRLLPEGISAEQRRDISVKWERSSNQQNSQVLLVTRIFMNLTLASFSSNPYWLLASVALQTVSLVTTARWKWLRYEHSFTRPRTVAPVGQDENGQIRLGLIPALIPRLKTIKFSYFRPFLPAHSQKARGDQEKPACIVYCGEEEGSLVQSCSQHAAHETCLVGTIYTGLSRFNDLNLYFWRHVRPGAVLIRKDDRGRTTFIEWSIRIDKTIFPSCSGCRNQPAVGELEVYTEDVELPGEFCRASVEIHEETPLVQPAAQPVPA